MKYYLIILILFVSISSCRKEETKLKKEEADFEILYTLDSSNKLYSLIKSINDIIEYKIEYYYYSDSITETKYNSNNNIIYIHTYYINSTGLADSSCNYDYNTNSKTKYIYEYNSDNFLIKKIDVRSDSIYTENVYTYEYGNLTQIDYYVDLVEYSLSCSDKIVYNSNSANFNTLHYFSDIIGVSSNNLIEKITYNNGCPGGPSARLATSEYIYLINDNDYITKRKEIYTPAGHQDEKNPETEEEIIEYKYLFR